MLRGPRVLLSRPTVVLVCFWTGVAAMLLSGGITKGWLVRDTQSRAPSIVTHTPPAPIKQPPKVAPAREPASFGGQPIEDPHRSLTSFAAALARTEARKGPTRVLHFGDSQIDLDHISGGLRRRYQARYGAGGIGFVPLVRPWRWFRLAGTSHRASKGWRIHRIADARLIDRRLGLGMAACESEGKAWARVAGHGSRIIISYLAQPAGGSFFVRIDGKRQALVSTRYAGYQTRYLSYTREFGRHRVQVRARGKVRFFGVVFERSAPGITWENLPMVSGRFHRLASADLALWVAQLKSRDPHLLVFQFGANDTISYGGSIARYQDRVQRVLHRARVDLPNTSCLVIGPLDQLVRNTAGRLVPRHSWERVTAAQRKAALTARCAFWDARAAMGGPGSLRQWRQRRLVRADLVHLNHDGADALANLFAAALDRKVAAEARR